MDWFAGATAVVTGAANGIGRSTAEVLDELGARVIAVDIDGAALSAAFDGTHVTTFQADVSTDGQALAAALLDRFGTVGLLVNNVGVDSDHGFLDLSQADFDRVFATNLRGPWFLTRGLIERMVEDRRSGSIVFVSSLHDSFIRTVPHYSASKAAVAMLVKELAHEFGPHGIRVNAVSPGFVPKAPVPLAVDTERDRIRALIPLGRVGEPRQVAKVIAVLLCDQWSDYVTGANVRVDGGLSLHSWSVLESER
jgi:3-oxoacyl-[acyl-carrier protein] reductase